MQGGTNGGVLMAKQGEDMRTEGLRLPEESHRCPRCDSSNTKFCYYNNYSLSQPRHFCKTCRRYWTKGGALRNVPIGGGCRKNKKSTTNKANSSSVSSKSFNEEETNIGVINNVNISSIVQLPSETLAASNALKLFNGFSSSPSIDFHVGGLPKFQPSALNRFLSYGDLSTSSSSSLSSSSSVASNGMNSGLGLCGYSPGFFVSQGSFVHSGVTSSIESLSIMNADLHWKLQQQRFAMLLAEGSDHSGMDMSGSGVIDQSQYGSKNQHQQQVCLQNPNSVRTIDGACSFGSSKRTASVVECGEPRESEWIFENSWPDLHQYSSLP